MIGREPMEGVSGRLFSAGWAAQGRHGFVPSWAADRCSHTLDRADRLTQPEQKVTVILRSHSWEAWPQFGNRPIGMVVVQPANRDTGGLSAHSYPC